MNARTFGLGAVLTLSALSHATAAFDLQMNLTAETTPLKGIWYKHNQTFSDSYQGLLRVPKYSGGFATYTANHAPMAIERNGDLYYTFAQDSPNGGMRVGIAVKRQSSGQTQVEYLRDLSHPDPAINTEGRDPHQNVTLSFDDAGYLYVYQSARSTENGKPHRIGRIYKSTAPETLPKATDVFSHDHRWGYAQPWNIRNQQVVVFTNYQKDVANNTWVRYPSVYNPQCHPAAVYAKNQDGQLIRDSNNELVFQQAAGARLFNAGGYSLSLYKNNRLHVVHNFHRAATVNNPVVTDSGPEYSVSHPDLRSNLYYMYSDDGGCQWKNARGQQVSLPVQPGSASSTLVYQSENTTRSNVYIQDVEVQQDGSVIVLTVDSSDYNPLKGAREHVVYKIKPGGQLARSVIHQSNHNYNTGFFFHRLGKSYVIVPHRDSGEVHYGGGNAIMLREYGDNDWRTNLGCGPAQLNGNYNYARKVLNGYNYIGFVSRTLYPNTASDNFIDLLKVSESRCYTIH